MSDTTNDKIKELYELQKYVFEYYGMRHQIIKLAEEAAEVAQAAAVCANHISLENLMKLRDELADARNVAFQLGFIEGHTDEGEPLLGWHLDTLDEQLKKMRREKARIKAGLAAPVCDWMAMEKDY